MARKTKYPNGFTNEQISQVKKLSAMLTVDQIAHYFEISDAKFKQMREDFPEIDSAYKAGKANAISGVANKLLQVALSGNVSAMTFYLKTQGGWRETNNIDHSNSDGSLRPTVIEIVGVTPKKNENKD